MVREADITTDHPLDPYKGASAKEKLVNILKSRTIFSSPMPLSGEASAVCFTECVWDALVAHGNRYSSYGVVFSKRTIFHAGGGPALYVRGDILRSQINNIPKALSAFLVPFDPDAQLHQGVIQDWIHEREWRLPEPINFEYSDVRYVLVETIEDAGDIMQTVGTIHLPANRIIPMDAYRTIRDAWSAS